MHIFALSKINQVVKEFNCKLAINKTDYNVPLMSVEYGGDVLLDIQFSGDKRSIGLINNFVCWKDIKATNVFDSKNREKFRSIYHHTPTLWLDERSLMVCSTKMVYGIYTISITLMVRSGRI